MAVKFPSHDLAVQAIANTGSYNGMDFDQGPVTPNESNTAVGVDVMRSVVAYPGSGTDSQYNTGVGKHALRDLTLGSDNTGVGAQALRGVTSGYHNTGIGHYAAGLTTTGGQNVALGTFSLNNNITGSENTAIGMESLYSTLGNYNVGVGRKAGFNVTTGTYTVAIGYKALEAVTTGNYNVGLGGIVLSTLTTGDLNVAIGHSAGEGITTGSGNTILGANLTGLAAALTDNVILGSGGVIRARYNNDTWTFTSSTGAAFTGSSLALGTSVSSDVGLYVRSSALTTTDQYGAIIDPQATSAATASGTALQARLRTEAAVYTMVNGRTIHIADAALGATSAVTNLYGLYIDAIVSGTTLNYAIKTLGGRIGFVGLPTASAGLASGDIWSDGGTLKVVP